MRRAHIVAALLAFSISSPCFAGDEPEHRPLIYALAITAGFSPEEAKVIADGSWSMDRNKSTLALQEGFKGKIDDFENIMIAMLMVATDPEYADELLNHKSPALDKLLFSEDSLLARVGPAAFIHSLVADPRQKQGDKNQPTLDAAYRKYIREQSQGLQNSGKSEETVKRVKLLLIGQYMHQLVDSFVHPHDPLLGHLRKLHGPDYAIHNEAAFGQAAFKALRALTTLLPEVRPAEPGRLKKLGLETTEQQLDFCRNLVASVKSGYSSARRILHTRMTTEVTDPFDVTDREVRAVSKALEGAMSEHFQRIGTTWKISIPDFTRATVEHESGKATVSYPGTETVQVDGIVPWMVKNEPELANAVREGMRDYVRTWKETAAALGTSAKWRATGKGLSDLAAVYDGPSDPQVGRKAIEALKKVGGVNLDVATDFLAALDVPGARSGDPIARLEKPILVSLGRVLEERPRQLPIGRVHGFMRTADDLYLIGTAADPLIDLNCLVVAMKYVLIEGNMPACSLDPDPDNPGGPQYARVIGVPHRSQFASIMLHADYEMKKILFGLERVPAAEAKGYRSYWDLETEAIKKGRSKDGTHRFWLQPVAMSERDILTSADGSTMIFDSGVHVLTEDSLTRNGTYVVTQESAASFSAHYAQIAAAKPIFRRLHALVDLVTLAQIWRRFGLKTKITDGIAALPITAEEVPTSFPGLTRTGQFGNEIHTIWGGVQTRPRVRRHSFDIYDSLQMNRLHAVASGNRELATRLDDDVVLPRPQRDGLIEVGLRHLEQGRLEEGLAVLQKASQQHPLTAEVDGYRAQALALLGRGEEARKAASAAVSKDPADADLRALRVEIEIRFGGKPEGSPADMRAAADNLTRAGMSRLRADAADAVRMFDFAIALWPDNPDALFGRGLARSTLGDLDRALMDLESAAAIFRKLGDKSREARMLAASAHVRIALSGLDKDENAKGLKLSHARRDAEAAIKLAPDEPRGYYAAVVSEVLIRDLSGAKAEAWGDVVRRAFEFAKKWPNLAMAHAAIGIVSYYLRDYDPAIAAFSKALAVDPTHTDSLLLRAGSHEIKSKWKEAIADYEAVKRLLPQMRARLEEGIKRCRERIK
jgi:tetratricopeptide (TPR) repeat protein